MSFSEWKAYTIEELGKVVTGKTPPTKDIENFGNEYPFITPVDMNGQKNIYSTARNLSEIGKEKVKNFLLPKNTVCVSCIGSDMGKVVKTTKPSVTNQQINSIICYDDFDSDFVYYAMKLLSPTLRSIGHQSTAVPIINKTDFSGFEIYAPEDKEVQTRIASILSSIDDAIELNQQTNQTLEEIAKTLFKEWFVNFNYPNATGEMQSTEMGDIPVGWKIENIGELFDFVIGGDWGKDNEESIFSNYCTVIRGTDIPDILNSNLKSIPKRFIQESKLKTRRLQEGDIVFEISGGSKDQATGRNLLITKEILNLFEAEVIPASFCRLIRTKDIKTGCFLGVYLNCFYSEGGTWHYQLQSTGISNFQFQVFASDHKIVVPPDDLINSFFELVQPIIKQIGENISENQTFFTLRDTLLPKLMKGEIEINGQ